MVQPVIASDQGSIGEASCSGMHRLVIAIRQFVLRDDSLSRDTDRKSAQERNETATSREAESVNSNRRVR